MVRYVENQPSYLLKKFFEAVTVLGDNLLFSIMTFRLKTLSIRSNIIFGIEMFKTFRLQTTLSIRSVIMSSLRCLRLSDLKVKVLKILSMLLVFCQ